MNTFQVILVCLVSLLMQVPFAAAFCNRPQPRLVCAEYFDSQAVVKAKLTRIRQIRDSDDPLGIVGFSYTLQVLEVMRGQISPTFRVYESNDSGRAAFDWKVSNSYLLFLWFSKSDHAWVLDGCGNSKPLSIAGPALKVIKAVQHDHSGTGLIQGVVSEKALDHVLPGVSIEALGAGQRYSSKTDAHGEFRLKVPTGEYEIRATQPGAFFEAADISYAKPKHLRVQSGGCVQLQLVREGRTSNANSQHHKSAVPSY